ncbi:prepilin peptidase [Actinomyces trachealis]|uniref:prepilin peptidase n=1 Tax=Actinomyces trachealis TaxID=2763540 RepID=UPI001892C038|nr:prepilin peptidase [Actinomyces trachealis]
MSSSLPLAALALVLLAGLALTVGPVLRYTRAYVERLEARCDAADSVAEAAPAIRRQWLLSPASQLLLALVLGVITAVWSWRHGQVRDGVVAVPTLMLLGAAGSVDAVCHRLPNRLLGAVVAWLGLGLAVTTVVALARGGSLAAATATPLRAVLVAAVLGGSVLLLALLRTGLGPGDVKLCGVTGLWLGQLGWSAALTGLLVGFFLASLLAAALLVTRRATLKTRIALGPALVLGAWAAWLLQVAAV